MHHFVNGGAERLAFQFAAEPARVAIHRPAARRGRHARHVIAKADGDVRRGLETFARQHLDQFRIPLQNHGAQLFVGPFREIGRDGGVDDEVVFSIRRGKTFRDGLGVFRARRSFDQFRPIAINYVNFAEKSVAETIRRRGGRDVEKEVAILPERAVRIRNAHAVLPAAVAFLRTRVDVGHKRPSSFFRIRAAFRSGIEAFGGPGAGIEFVNLWPTRTGVPRVRVDLLDFSRTAQINLDAPAIRAGIEEEIGRRLIALRREPAIVELVERAAVLIAYAVHERELRRGGRVVLHGRGYAVKFV